MKNIFSSLLSLCLCIAVQAQEHTYTRSMDRVGSMDPIEGISLYAARAIKLQYETLLEYDYVARPYRLIPSLAEALPEVDATGRIYTFRIRRTAQFHPDPCFGLDAAGAPRGRPVTAHDVVYSLKRLVDRKLPTAGAWIVEDKILGLKAFAEASGRAAATDYAQPVAGLRIVDAQTVQITLNEPLYVFPFSMTMACTAIVPHEAIAYYGADFGQHPVGSGPYRLTAWRRNHQMTFARVAAWPGWKEGPAAFAASDDRVPFDTVIYRTIEDVSTQWICFLAGELDFLGEVSRDNWDAVIDPSGGITADLQARGISLYSIAALEVAYIGFNMDDPVVGPNKKLRQALNCAFHGQAWERFYNNRVEAADGAVPRGVMGYAEQSFPYRYNLELAKRLMVEAGYPEGIDPQTGRRLVLTLDLGRASQDMRETVELLTAFYAKIGVQLQAQYHNWPVFLKRVSERRSQLFRMGWVGDYSDPENFMMTFYGKNVSPGANRVNYVNPAFDTVFERAIREPDSGRRAAHWAEAQAIIREDCPWVFLHFPKAYSLCHRRVLNYCPTDFVDGTEKYLRCLRRDRR